MKIDPNDNSPFDSILPRTPYLVVPKLAIQSMPLGWQHRLALLLSEAEEAGIETPAYYVFRDDDVSPPGSVKKLGSYEHPFYKIISQPNDDWADYRHRKIETKVTLRTRLLEKLRDMGSWTIWKHLKRNSHYMVVTHWCHVQCEYHIVEGDQLTLYFNDEFGWCVRPAKEFNDGRFEKENEDANR